MQLILREYKKQDIKEMCDIWNDVVEAGNAFPQEAKMTEAEAECFFAKQSFCAVALQGDELVGLYILHPNNEGRCGHLSNASYAVKATVRGQHIGEQLVKHCIKKAVELGFRILQFNAVVKTNYGAIHLYEKLGFVKLGVVPGGFRLKDGSYEDIVLFYYKLQ